MVTNSFLIEEYSVYLIQFNKRSEKAKRKVKKIITTISVILSVYIMSASVALAASPTIINARVLPTVWYSTLSVNDGDSIKIYAGIQNNSGVDFTGTATFYVDDAVLNSTSFSSVSGNLIYVTMGWVAQPGTHNVQVSIATSLSADKTLVSASSDKSSISIIRNITAASVQNAVVNTGTTVINNINGIANNLADRVEATKDPAASGSLLSGILANDTSANSSSGSIAKKKAGAVAGAVLGTSTGPVISKNSGGAATVDTNVGPMTYIYNTLIDLAAFLIRKWIWTLGAIILLIIFFKLKSKFSRD